MMRDERPSRRLISYDCIIASQQSHVKKDRHPSIHREGHCGTAAMPPHCARFRSNTQNAMTP
jgi:hypothetical protein